MAFLIDFAFSLSLSRSNSYLAFYLSTQFSINVLCVCETDYFNSKQQEQSNKAYFVNGGLQDKEESRGLCIVGV